MSTPYMNIEDVWAYSKWNVLVSVIIDLLSLYFLCCYIILKLDRSMVTNVERHVATEQHVSSVDI